MKLFYAGFSVLFLIISLFVDMQVFASADNDERIRAQIGIQFKTAEKSYYAKAREKIKGGEYIRIYIHPEKTSYVYVVHSDGNAVTLLNMTEQKIHSSTLVLPSLQAFYRVGGDSPKEVFTIICSKKKIPKLDEIIKQGTSLSKWDEIEKELIKQSRIIELKNQEIPFEIAGNVRAIGDDQISDPFIKKLRIFSGRGLIVKKYEFKIVKLGSGR